MAQAVEYGPGGYDPTKPNNNVVSTQTIPDDTMFPNLLALQAAGRQALIGNRSFVAIASPTNAQVLAQTKALTRQNNGIIRLLLGLLDGTD